MSVTLLQETSVFVCSQFSGDFTTGGLAGRVPSKCQEQRLGTFAFVTYSPSGKVQGKCPDVGARLNASEVHLQIFCFVLVLTKS